MEHPSFESQPEFDPQLVSAFQAVDTMSKKFINKDSQREFIAKELRRRAIGHNEDPVAFGQQFNTWKEKRAS